MSPCEIVALLVCIGILIVYIIHNHGHVIK